MFLKAFKVKSSTAIRGSDRRKLRAEVGRCFPALPPEVLSEVVPNKEEITVSRTMTHGGGNVTVYSLCGEPIFFEVEKRIIPTVYTLWKYPNMLPRFTTWPPVMENLRGGADFMLPGAILPEGGIASFDQFERNSLWCITLKGNRAPVAVGITLVSRKDLYEDGMRGKGVNVLHVYTDFLWAHGSKTPLPQLNELQTREKQGIESDEETPEHMRTEDDRTCSENDPEKERKEEEVLSEGLQEIDISENTEDPTGDHTETTPAVTLNSKLADEAALGQEAENVKAPAAMPTLEDMDSLLEYCFFCAFLRMKPERDLPILTSAFFRNHMLPYCPEGKTVDVKKSSFKKLSKFLQTMHDRGLIKVQEVSKGVDHIVDVSFDNEEVRTFKSSIPALPPKPEKSTSAETEAPVEGPSIEDMYAVSAALVRIFSEFGYVKGSVLSQIETRKVITSYVKSHELVSGNNKKSVVLDPMLTSAIVNKNEDVQQLTWDALFNRVASKMNSCYKITLPGREPLIKKGKIDQLEIKIEQRMGNKKVTLVRNLDAYGIDPQQFAHTIQLKAACSTAVSQLPGKHRVPGMQVMVQGNQVHLVVMALLEDYRIPRKFITGLELLKSSKKKK